MQRVLAVSSATGFVRAAGFMWLVAPDGAFRCSADGVVLVPRPGLAIPGLPPHRLGTSDALWTVRYDHPIPLTGPDLAPGEPGDPLALSRCFHAAAETACWLTRDDRVFRIRRSDGAAGRHQVEPGALDLAPCGERTAVLYADRIRFLRDKTAVDALSVPSDPRGRIAFVRGSALWIASRGQIHRIERDRLVESRPPGLEPAGDALAERDGDTVRLLDHPRAKHNALRGARHLWVDGDVVWAARDREIVRLDSAGERIFDIDAPSGDLRRLAPAGASVLAVSTRHGGFSVERHDGRWTVVARGEGHALDAAFDAGALWVATTGAVFRCPAPRFSPEPLRLNADTRISACGGTVAALAAGDILVRRAGETVWTPLPAPPGTAVADVAVLGSRIAAVLIENRRRVLGAWEDGGWKRCALDFGALETGAAAWGTGRDLLYRWDGGAKIQAWRVAVPVGIVTRTDDARPDALWWRLGTVFYRADTVSLDVREVINRPDATMETAMEGPEGDFWVAAAGGYYRIPREETKLLCRLTEEEPRPAAFWRW
jgi:hypothetical protein